MAKEHDIVKLADFREIKDPAYLAWQRMNAAGEDDDDAYMSAMIDLETKPAKSLLGVRAKLDRLHWYVGFIREHIEQGGEIGTGDWDIMELLYESIDEFMGTATARMGI